MDTIVYKIENKLYINMTNRCSNNCDFCVRNGKSTYENYPLWLSAEPTAELVKCEISKNLHGISEVVFCGFGEPLYRVEDVIDVANYIHTLGLPTRINTNGQAKFISGLDTAKRLGGAIDAINISLNATDKESYQSICHSEFGADSYDELLRFAKDCKQYIPKVILSIVDCVSQEELEKAKILAEELGVNLRIRALIS